MHHLWHVTCPRLRTPTTKVHSNVRAVRCSGPADRENFYKDYILLKAADASCYGDVKHFDTP
jgi:hypothetical protein